MLWRALGLVAVFLVAIAWPPRAAAAGPVVRVEASAALGLPDPDRKRFEAAIADAARRGVAEAGVDERADAPTRLWVEVAWSDERRIDYVGHIEVQGEADPLALRGFRCDMCGTEALLDRVRSEVALALGTMTWPADAPASTVAAEEPGSEPTSPTDADRRARADRVPVRLGPLGWSGVGVGSLGVVSVGVGAVLWTRDDRVELRRDDPGGPVWKRSLHPPGIALVAAGGSAVVLGAALLLVDRVRARRRALAVHPSVGPRWVGLGGRF